MRPYDISSLSALIAFEAAARKLSFKLAAVELNVTPPAVSHQIKALEAELGCALFVRRSRSVELTEQGALLFVAVREGLEKISDGVLQTRHNPGQVDVTIAATTSMSALWLTPRISAFWRTNPNVTISQIVSDVPVPGGRPDLTIYYGEKRRGMGDDRELFRDRILALGAPGFAEEHDVHDLAGLADCPLVHSRVEDMGWTTWEDWFEALGMAGPRGGRLRVNNDMIALQAAQDGAGAVLGWERLVSGLISQGRLVQLVPDFIPSPSPFYLRIHPHASAKARDFADWLLDIE